MGNTVLFAYSDEKKTTATTTGKNQNPDGSYPILATRVLESPAAFRKLPDFSFIEHADAKKNRVVMAPRFFSSGDPDNIDSFSRIPIPAGNIELLTAADLSKWNAYVSGSHLQDGLSSTGDIAGNMYHTVTGTIADILDRDKSTALCAAIFGKNAVNAFSGSFCLKIRLPAIDMDFESLHLGMSAKVFTQNSVVPGREALIVMMPINMPFFGPGKTGNDSITKYDHASLGATAFRALEFDSMNEEFYDPAIAGTGENFIIDKDASYDETIFTGYNNYKLVALTDQKKLSIYKEMLLLFQANFITVRTKPVTLTHDSVTVQCSAGDEEFTSAGDEEFTAAGDFVMLAETYPDDLGPIHRVESINTSAHTITLTTPYTGVGGSGTILFSILTVNLNELCLVAKKSLSIQSALYSGIRGRIFAGPGDTGSGLPLKVWGGRRNAADMIADPLDQAEHFLRLGNWTDGVISPYNERPGKRYSLFAKINTAATLGGFDYAAFSAIPSGFVTGAFGALAPIRDCRPAFQEPEKSVGEIVDELCRSFFFFRYTDGSGNECVVPSDCAPSPATSSAGSPPAGWNTVASLTDADIPEDEEAGEIEGAEADWIHSQPVVKYCKNYASDRFDKFIGVTDITVDDATYAANPNAYMTGFPAGSETLRDLVRIACRQLYFRFGITEPDSEQSERPYIRTVEDALWHLLHWVWWMTTHQRRIEVPTDYLKADGMAPGMLVALKLRRRTGNLWQCCRIEKIEWSKEDNHATWGLILIDQ